MSQSKEPLASGPGRDLPGSAAGQSPGRALVVAAGRAGRLCSPVVGVIAGLGAVAFLLSLQLMYSTSWATCSTSRCPRRRRGRRRSAYPWPWWLVVLVPTVGGLISGLLVFTLAPEAEGHGTDAMIRAFHRGGDDPGPGPVDQGGRVDHHDRHGGLGRAGGADRADRGRVRLVAGPACSGCRPANAGCLMLAGAAGGIGAIFRAPLGGAMFAGEVLYSSTAIESAALLPCLASSIVAYSTFALFITPQPIFIVPPHRRFTASATAAVHGPDARRARRVGWLYVRVFYGLRDRFFKPMPIPRHIKPAVGGLLAGHPGPGVPAGDDRRLWLGAVGSDRHAAGAGPAGRAGVRPAHGDVAAADPGGAQDRGDGADDQLRRQRRRVRPVDLDRRHARRGLRPVPAYLDARRPRSSRRRSRWWAWAASSPASRRRR